MVENLESGVKTLKREENICSLIISQYFFFALKYQPRRESETIHPGTVEQGYEVETEQRSGRIQKQRFCYLLVLY